MTLSALATGVWAQSTQGLISGSVVNVLDGAPISSARVLFTNTDLGYRGSSSVSVQGRFELPLLPPGTYRIRIEAGDYQAQELEALKLDVAGTLDLTFRLRPLKDVWEQRERHNLFLPGNSVLVFFGPDVDLSRTAVVEYNPGRSGILESTFSQVVDPAMIRQLPLPGRDAYSVLALQPGVTSDAGTSRGLGLSVNGQRPTATNYMLDGLENNNYLLSGPLTTVAPEAIQEYRVSTNNFSAEYGRTAGVVANAVTRSGGNEWHGIAYFHVRNQSLNANDFQRNLAHLSRRPLSEYQPGFFVGGPLWRKRIFLSAALEHTRFRSETDAQEYTLPSVQFISQLRPDSLAATMFSRYAPPKVDGVGPCVIGGNQNGCSHKVPLAAPTSINQTLGLTRLDKLFQDGGHRMMVRALVSKVSRPDFSWSPYKEFISPLVQNATGIASSWIDASRPGLTFEARLGWSTDVLQFNRAESQVPSLSGPQGFFLPGSPLFYSYQNRSHNLEAVGNVVITREKHIFKFGGGLLLRWIGGYQTTEREGFYSFLSLSQIAADRPQSFNIAVLRNGPVTDVPDYKRDYRYRQWFGFFQGTWRATSRLSFNYGVRYENFGVPTNTGSVKDTFIALGTGDTLVDALKSSTGFITPTASDQKLYEPDNRDWAGRAGFAYAFQDTGRTLIRGAYGIFYDRPFDNLWETIRHTSVQDLNRTLNGQIPWNYLEWARSTPDGLTGVRREVFPTLTLFQPGLRTPYVQSYFISLRHLVTSNLSIEVAGLGSLGRQLMATDIINRAPGRITFAPAADMSYRSNQGSSSYSASSLTVSYRAHHYLGQASYTWSHSIDNQSDALLGEYGNLGFATGDLAPVTSVSAFSRQFDSRADRGNSDFDQRHSLVMLGLVDLPNVASQGRLGFLFRNWHASSMAAVRSGLPFTVYSVKTTNLPNNRATVLDPSAVYERSPVTGGSRWLNPAAFANPASGQVGNSGRNAFGSPGFWNVDASVSRTIRMRTLGEAGKIHLRVDVFNLLNHANLGMPISMYGQPGFGDALYGRQGYSNGFPAAVPFRENARQLQLMIRAEF